MARERSLAAADAEVPIVINARVDAFLPTSGIRESDRLAEAVRRGRLYRDAGADCIYPIGVRHQRDIATLVTELPGPINGNPSDDLSLAKLRELGVARVSYGSSFYRTAMADLKTAVQGCRPTEHQVRRRRLRTVGMQSARTRERAARHDLNVGGGR
jgi:2-methylisocitrate lyase-like PEP mutase family enzyme